MTPLLSQRWRERKASYRHLGDRFDPSRYDVAAIKGDVKAMEAEFVREMDLALLRISLERQGGGR